jgi:hypothetical protein
MISSEIPKPCSMSGVCGPPYTSAVSKRLMPCSSASSMIEKAAASSVTQPKFIVPSARRLTLRPERPRCVYSIEFSLSAVMAAAAP